METLSQLAGSLVALFGTLLVALIGFYQWRKQQQAPTRAIGAEARRKAYEGLWQMLEEINLMLRDERGGNPEIHALLRQMNQYFLRNSAYFDDADQKQLNDYLAALDRLRTAVYSSGDEDVEHAWARTWAQMPESLDLEVRAASQEVDRLRAAIKERVRRVVSAA